MTDIEKTKIEELRMSGVGYGRISKMLGISENTVKSFCRRSRLTGAPENTRQATGDAHFCQCCGRQVMQYPGRKEKKFCSDTCRNKWWNSHLGLVKRKAMYEFTCPTCGKAFSAYGNRNRKYCSHECYIEDRFGGRSCG